MFSSVSTPPCARSSSPLPAPLTRRILAIFGALGLLFWALYGSVGWGMAERHLLENDLFFHSDVRRVVNDVTIPAASHRRTNVHPLFVLLANPAGTLLAKALGSTEHAAVLVNSLVGGMGIAAAGLFFALAGVPLRRGVLCTLLLGCSTTHLYFGSLPETYAWSGLSIVLLFLVALCRPNDWRWAWPAGVLAFGILSTNLAMAAITQGSTLLPGGGAAYEAGQAMRRFRRWVSYGALVVGLTALLALAQLAIWPTSALFFSPAAYRGESRFVKAPSASRHFAHREAKLLRHVFGYDWFAPALKKVSDHKRGYVMELQGERLRAATLPGNVALILWLALLGGSVWGALHGRLHRLPIFAALAVCLLFNQVLHTVYGDDFFLYGCNSCFVLLAMVAMATREVRCWRCGDEWLDLGFLLLLTLQVANNWGFVAGLLALRR